MNIGLMQGRLIKPKHSLIQEFPQDDWIEELELASSIGINLIEWVVDERSIDSNPIYYDHPKVSEALNKHAIRLESISDDYFMQGKREEILDSTIISHLETSFHLVKALDIGLYVLPFLERTSLKNLSVRNIDKIFTSIEKILPKNLTVCIESDLSPKDLTELTKRINMEKFKINYDIGNSGHEGYNYKEELDSYFQFIFNVHVKDRKFNGPSVPLGEGDSKVFEVIEELKNLNYNRNFILQAARDQDSDNESLVKRYYNAVSSVIW